MAEREHVHLQAVTLDLKTAIAAVLVVATGVASTVGGMYAIAHGLRSEMVKIEQRWVDRVAEVEERIRTEMHQLESRIPPPQVTQRFEHIENRLDRIEQRLP